LNHSLTDSFEIIVSVNNNSFGEFTKSKYFNTELIQWKCLHQEVVSMSDSINSAIKFSTCDWLFILSDDDCINKYFLKDIDLPNMCPYSLYATKINFIDENGRVFRENKGYPRKVYNGEETLDLFFLNKFHNHISLLVFSRKLLDAVGPFEIQGYPNGYYMDVVFHGKAFAACNCVYTSNNTNFSRRESSIQASAKFYFGEEVNDYFEIIVNNLFSNEKFNRAAIKRGFSKKKYYKKLIQERFQSEWSKLNRLAYNTSNYKKLEFLYKYLSYWKTGKIFKVFSFLHLLKFYIKLLLPQRLKNKIKLLLYN